MSNSESVSVSADEVLRASLKVLDQRGKLRDYPSGERSMPEIVELFAQLTGIQLSVSEGYTFMMALKLTRLKRKPLLDDALDLINYTALRTENVLNLAKGLSE